MTVCFYILGGAIGVVLLIIALVWWWLARHDYRLYYLDLRKIFPGRFNPSQVAAYYDKWHIEYQKYYGNIIQAWRPESEEELNEHTLQAAELRNGMKILDAGCGYAGPAEYFATRLTAEIDAVTVSVIQNQKARERLQGKTLLGKLNLVCNDYNEFVRNTPPDTYDRVLFLESFGYAQKPETLAGFLHKAIKKGGRVFIKDFFKHELPADSYSRQTHIRAIQNMDKEYLYNTLNLYHTIYIFRRCGFELLSVMKPPYVFDNYQVVNGFQDNNGIDLYEGRPKFFIVEPFELTFIKPLV